VIRPLAALVLQRVLAMVVWTNEHTKDVGPRRRGDHLGSLALL
jgi:hypothetical protein